MAIICTVKVINRFESDLVIANSILSPKSKMGGYQSVNLFSEQNVKDVIAAERLGRIKLFEPIPEEVLKQFPFFASLKADSKSASETETATVEENSAESATPVEEQEVPSEPSTENLFLGIDEIEAMTGKDLKAYISDHNLEIKGYSSLTTRELKDAVLAYFGHEVPETEVE